MPPLVKIRRNFMPQATILNAAHCLAKHAEHNEEGRFLYLLAALTMEAFALEGYVNLIGPRLFQDKWSEDKFDGTRDKIKKVLERAYPSANFGKQPFQTIHELFNFRNAMAHPKPVIDLQKTLSSEKVAEHERKYGQWLPTAIEEYATLENANRVREKLKEIYELTWNKDWPEGSPYISGGSEMVAITPPPDLRND